MTGLASDSAFSAAEHEFQKAFAARYDHLNPRELEAVTSINKAREILATLEYWTRNRDFPRFRSRSEAWADLTSELRTLLLDFERVPPAKVEASHDL